MRVHPLVLDIDEVLKTFQNYGDPISYEVNLPTIVIHKYNLYCWQDDGRIMSYNLINKTWSDRHGKHNSSGIKRLCVSNNGRYICSSSSNCLVIWSNELIMLNSKETGELNDLCITSDSKLLITSSKIPKIKIWSLPGMEPLYTLSENAVSLIVSSQNILYSATRNFISLLNLNNFNSLINPLEGHTGTVNCLKLTNNENWLLSGSNDMKIMIWDTSKNTINAIIDTGERVLGIEVSSNDQFFATANKSIKIWSFQDQNPFFVNESRSVWKNLKISNDSRFLIVSSDNNQMRIYNINNQGKK